MPDHSRNISFVLPSRNEAVTLAALLAELGAMYPQAEILVIDDGSTDNTREICLEARVNVLSHPYPKGNGAAIKTGARAAKGAILLCMDADGQHRPEDIPRLLDKLAEGYDMVVGARGKGSQAGLHRAMANDAFSRFAGWMVNQRVADLTSGFRAVRADKFRRYLYLLPNGFSYPTTITMSFFRAGHSVAYVPIHTPRRAGRSHLHPLRDGVRFLLIILKIGTLYSPLKVFLPISAAFFMTGMGYYLHTYLREERFTNMSALLLVTSVMVFLIGLVSEQITSLNYHDSERE